MCDKGFGVGKTGLSVYLDFQTSINRLGEDVIKERYGNLFDMYQRITDENPYQVPMRIYPAVHYTMGGLWVDYNLMSTIPGLHVLGEANFSDHGANRLGASALMQGLADGYFVIPYTLGHYLANVNLEKITIDHEAFKEAEDSCRTMTDKLLNTKGKKTVQEFHRELGKIMWEHVGMGRNKNGLEEGIKLISGLRDEFKENVNIPQGNDLNKNLESAGRLSDFFELGELIAKDALLREESCGGHFREEHQTEEGEALRDDEKFCYVRAWEYKGEKQNPEQHKEDLVFENVKLVQRSYK